MEIQGKVIAVDVYKRQVLYRLDIPAFGLLSRIPGRKGDRGHPAE